MSDDRATTQTKSETLLRLSAPFSASAHKKVNKGSGNQTYVPWTDAVERMNGVLGADWSFRVVREGLTETEAWVLGEITATIDGVVTVRQHYGCESISKGQRGVADLFKIAASDAIRKAATLIGVGMYLSVKEEREEIEAQMRAEVATAVKAQQEASKKVDPTPRSNGSAAPAAPAAASTPAASGAAPSSSSTTAMPAQLGKPVAPTPLHDAEKAAILTGANPPTPIDPARRELEVAYAAGRKYAESIKLQPEKLDISALTNEELSEVVEALRSQCRYVNAERKKQAS